MISSEKCKSWSSSLCGARGSVVGWGTVLQTGRSPVQVSDEVDFFNLRFPSSHIMALRSTQPLTEMCTRNFSGGKKRPASRADNLCRHLWAECLKMWEHQPLATLRASTICTGKTLPLPRYVVLSITLFLSHLWLQICFPCIFIYKIFYV
jgi:hypothetical protein